MCTVVLSAHTRGCSTPGGIEQIYMIIKSEREVSNVVYTVTNGALTMTGEAGNAYLWKPLQNGFALTQPITQDNNAGSTYITQTLEGVLSGYSAGNSYLIDQLRKGRFEAAIQMRDGSFVYAGLDNTGLQISGGDAGATGKAIGDANGVTINMTCESTEAAPTFSISEFNTSFTIVTA